MLRSIPWHGTPRPRRLPQWGMWRAASGCSHVKLTFRASLWRLPHGPAAQPVRPALPRPHPPTPMLCALPRAVRGQAAAQPGGAGARGVCARAAGAVRQEADQAGVLPLRRRQRLRSQVLLQGVCILFYGRQELLEMVRARGGLLLLVVAAVVVGWGCSLVWVAGCLEEHCKPGCGAARGAGSCSARAWSQLPSPAEVWRHPPSQTTYFSALLSTPS